jgi:hypothetical protein
MAEDDEVDRLYGLPLDEFVPERDALAKRLRAEKRRDEAAVVAKLGKPSVAAWAVNQVVRTQGPTIRELWAAGDALLAAQAGLLAGEGDADALRAASRAEQLALTPLLQAARGLLDARGRGPTATTLEKVGETLHAAAIEPGTRDVVGAGRLERELTHVGLGSAPSAPAATPAAEAPAEAEALAGGGRDRLVAAMRASIARERAREAGDGPPAPDAVGDDAAAEVEASRRAAEERATREAREYAEQRAEQERAAVAAREAEERERAEAQARAREAEVQREAEARSRSEQRAAEAEPAGAEAGEDAEAAAERALGEAVRAREAAQGDVVAAEGALAGARERLRAARERERAAAVALARLAADT